MAAIRCSAAPVETPGRSRIKIRASVLDAVGSTAAVASSGANTSAGRSATRPRKSRTTPTTIAGAPLTSAVRPMMVASAASAPRHSRSLMTIGRGDGPRSSGCRIRPATCGTPRTAKYSGDTSSVRTVRMSPSMASDTSSMVRNAITSAKSVAVRIAATWAGSAPNTSFCMTPPRPIAARKARRLPGSLTLRGRNSTASARLKTAAAAPIPRDSDSTATAVKPGARRRMRAP